MCLLWALLFLPAFLTAAKPPNIIFILTDDQGHADTGFSNPSTPFLTPALDALAAEGVRLTDYYVHPTCTPTRAALMTGRYSANVGLPVAFIPGSPGGLDPSIPVLPQHLAELGYQNYLVGKWHLGNVMEQLHPLNRGFHQFYGLLGGGLNYYTKQCGRGRYDWWRGREVEWENTTHATQLLNREALRIVDTHLRDPNSPPFFIYLAHPAPHDPLLVEPRLEERCSHIRNKERRLSCALVLGVDEGVAQLRTRLLQAGVLQDTVIAFSSDNGGVPYAGALNYPYRGAKTGAYEGGVRSPGFLHLPAVLGEGRQLAGLAHVSDWLPTLLAIVNTVTNSSTPPPQGLDGVDLLPAMLSRSPSPRQSVHINRDPIQDSQAYRRGQWKIIVGHHYMPFLFTKVYNETADSVWSVDGGSWRGVLAQGLLGVLDTVIGLENALFVKYIIWSAADSAHIGGLAKMKEARTLRGGNDLEAFSHQVMSFPSNLSYWRQQHSAAYPTVSLFDLDTDPQEEHNLADQHPALVEELLAEAERMVEHAPPAHRGDMVDEGAPGGPQEGTLYANLMSLGTNHDQVVPFGSYLPDSTDLAGLTYTRGFMAMGSKMGWLLAKLLISLVLAGLLPLVLVVWAVRRS